MSELKGNEEGGDIDQIVGGSVVPRGYHRYMVIHCICVFAWCARLRVYPKK